MQQTLLFPLLMVIYEIGAYLSNDMYLPALPTIATDLHITTHEAQLTLTTWFVGSASLQLISGPLSDRFGRKPIVISSGILYILSTFICASTSNFTLFLIARFFQGVTASAAVVAGYASIHELYNRTQAVRILAIMGSVIILAPAFGPLIGSIILLYVNWRWIFWIVLIWGVLITLCLALWMPESNPPEKQHPLQIKLLLKHYWNTITNWEFTALSLTFCFTFSGFIAWLTAAPFLITERFGYDIVAFGIFQGIVFSFYILANRFVKHLMEKLGINKLINVGLLITLIGGLSTILLSTWLPNYLIISLIIPMIFYSFGSGFFFAPLNRMAVEASAEPMGIRMAISSTYMTLFGTLGTLSMSVFYNGQISSLAYVLGIGILLSCLTKWLLTKRVD